MSTNDLQNLFEHYHIQNIKLSNNVPISHVVLQKSFRISLDNIYQYSYNFDTNLLNRFFDVDYINFGTDGIIRDLFYLNRGKRIWFETPNYMMVKNYANIFEMQYSDIQDADVVYVAYPNGATCKLPDIDLSNIRAPVKILDLSYFIYLCDNYADFMNKVEKFKQQDWFVLYGASKMLGLPGIRVGMCKTKTPEVFSRIHQPWQITSITKIIMDKCWNAELIDKHVEAIKTSKQILEERYREHLAFKTDGPYLALKKDIPLNGALAEYPEYYRMTVIDQKI